MTADKVPVWVWLPGVAEPTLAAELAVAAPGGRFTYAPDYLARDDALALDPIELRITRKLRGIAVRGTDGLPGVVRDAKPAGYGADRLMAQAGSDLTPLQLLERGVPDGVGAIEVCHDIERKLAWNPKSLDELGALAADLDAAAPSSRAIRRLNEDLDTSAGGERPKTTVVHDKRLWLAKMQARGERAHLPAREFVTMRLALVVGIHAAPVQLHTFGAHQVILIERFDRAGNPTRPQRGLYASAHTVLGLPLAATRGDPERSYLHLADRMRVWMRGRDDLGEQLQELWRRMAFNALVGNIDDHPHNHGLLHDGQGWRLSNAFDITPVLREPASPDGGVLLSMSTGAEGGSLANVDRLLASASHFGLEREAADDWLRRAASQVAQQWEPLLRKAAAPVVEGSARLKEFIDEVRPAFAFSEQLALAT